MLRFTKTAFDFGPAIAGSPVVRTVGQVVNDGPEALAFALQLVGSPEFSVASGVDGSCGSVVPAYSRCGVAVEFSPQDGAKGKRAAILELGGLLTGGSLEIVTGQGRALAAGSVSTTANPQVAQYTLTLPYKGSWTVNFGPTAVYGLSTSTVTASVAGTAASVYVAGMLPNTTYHMQAVVTLDDGATATDVDHTFTTGALPAGIPASLPATTTAGQTPQPGVELVNTLSGGLPTGAFATDLQGNVVWSYPFLDRGPNAALYPVKLLANGHFLCLIAPVYPNLATAGARNVIREFDLAGNTVQELSMTDLNARLAANGFPITLADFSHDIVVLPNGHYLVIANTTKNFTDLPGFPGVTQVVGDTVVDLDSNFQPRWLWDSFDHLDVNRHPMQFPDWTHANSVAYSKDDGNFIISLRHQNWVLKVDYRDGAGTGNTVWTLGEGGDFALEGGTDPTDWFYAQHHAEFVSPNTTGNFTMTLFDNGDDRQFPAGFFCGLLSGQTPCYYSSSMELQVDENLKTAKFLFHDILPSNLYSSFAGDTYLLANGNFEFNLAGVGSSAYVFEVTPGANVGDTPQTVWQLTVPGTNTYRATRLPSLYPGVQW